MAPGIEDVRPPEVQQQLDDFAAAMEAAGRGDPQSVASLQGFAGLVDLAKVLQSIQDERSPLTRSLRR